MTVETENRKMNFNELPTNEYMKYIEYAEKIQEMGLHTDRDVIQLAEMIFNQEKINESN